jgi:hypothetical protein
MRGGVALLAVVAALGIAGCAGGGPGQADRDRAVTEAALAYHRAKASGKNLDRGPCISEALPGLPDWVVDVAHDPRQPVDDKPANQCRRYRLAEAQHFVELDPGGKLIRAQ